MALSRKEKYQDLRSRLDEETTAAQATPMSPQIPGANGETDPDDYAHAVRHKHAHEMEIPQNEPASQVRSEVMSDLFGEVKQYNIEKGSRITDDTELNVLRSINPKAERMRRASHIVDMEQEESDGTTVRLQAIPADTAKTETSQPAKASRKEEAAPLPAPAKEEPALLPPKLLSAEEASQERIILGRSDILADALAEEDDLSVFSFEAEEEPEEVVFEETPVEEKPKRSPLAALRRFVLAEDESLDDEDEEDEVEAADMQVTMRQEAEKPKPERRRKKASAKKAEEAPAESAKEAESEPGSVAWEIDEIFQQEEPEEKPAREPKKKKPAGKPSAGSSRSKKGLSSDAKLTIVMAVLAVILIVSLAVIIYSLHQMGMF